MIDIEAGKLLDCETDVKLDLPGSHLFGGVMSYGRSVADVRNLSDEDYLLRFHISETIADAIGYYLTVTASSSTPRPTPSSSAPSSSASQSSSSSTTTTTTTSASSSMKAASLSSTSVFGSTAPRVPSLDNATAGSGFRKSGGVGPEKKTKVDQRPGTSSATPTTRATGPIYQENNGGLEGEKIDFDDMWAYMREIKELYPHLKPHQVRLLYEDHERDMMKSRSQKQTFFFFAKYFRDCELGRTVLNRDIRYVSSTPRTRRAFIHCFYSAYKHCFQRATKGAIKSKRESSLVVDDKGYIVTVHSLHQMLLLLCPNFPLSIVKNASRVTGSLPRQGDTDNNGNAQASSHFGIKALSFKVFILFYYSEFMQQSAFCFKRIDIHTTGKVDGLTYLEELRKMTEENAEKFSCPEIQVITEVIVTLVEMTITKEPLTQATSTGTPAGLSIPTATAGGAAIVTPTLLMFNDFCTHLFKHPGVYSNLFLAPDSMPLQRRGHVEFPVL